MKAISDNIGQVRERIVAAAGRAGIAADDILLVSVSKTKPIEQLKEAIAAGATDLGENRVQEAIEKHAEIGSQAVWHLIGHLQTNKARHAVRVFDMIHSVDRLQLGQEISKRCVALEKTMPVLVQVKTSDEDSKSGIEPDGAEELVRDLAALPGISIQGLMTIPAFTPDPEHSRPAFALLRKLSEQLNDQGIEGVLMRYLSMGMTNDFEVAIEEGSNLVRVGTAIFGARAQV